LALSPIDLYLCIFVIFIGAIIHTITGMLLYTCSKYHILSDVLWALDW